MKPKRIRAVEKEAIKLEKELKKHDSSLSGTKTNYQWKKVMSGKDVVAMLEKNGWVEVSHKGSHKKLKKNEMSCIVPMHDEIKRGTLGSIKSDVALAENK